MGGAVLIVVLVMRRGDRRADGRDDLGAATPLTVTCIDGQALVDIGGFVEAQGGGFGEVPSALRAPRGRAQMPLTSRSQGSPRLCGPKCPGVAGFPGKVTPMYEALNRSPCPDRYGEVAPLGGGTVYPAAMGVKS